MAAPHRQRPQTIDLEKVRLSRSPTPRFFPPRASSRAGPHTLTCSLAPTAHTPRNTQFRNQRLRVRFAGGREVVGLLRSFDGLLNIVLEETVEYLRDAADANTVTEATRYLGQVVLRGTAITVLGPEDGLKAIANPFGEEEGEAGEGGEQ